MSLKDTIESDSREALRKGEKSRLSTLRMLSSAALNRAIELRKKDVGLSDEEIVEVMRREIKKRKDAIMEYTKAGRSELAKKEEEELNVLLAYLPPEISDAELARVIEDGIREAGAKSQADFGKVMKTVMPVLKGRTSGDRISGVLKKKLAGE